MLPDGAEQPARCNRRRARSQGTVETRLFVPVAGYKPLVMREGEAGPGRSLAMIDCRMIVAGRGVGVRARSGVGVPVLDDLVDGVSVGVDMGALAAVVVMMEQRRARRRDAEREQPGDDRAQVGELRA